MKLNIEKSKLDSKVITRLKQEIKSGKTEVIDEFWNYVQNIGAPIIEEIEGDKDNSLVTFIYKGDSTIKNIVLLPPVIMNCFKENQMKRLLDTDIYYLSYKINNNIRFTYCFSINDSLDVNDTKRWDKLEYDKLNKNKMDVVQEGEESIHSYVVMPNAKENFWINERNDICKGTIQEHSFKSENGTKARNVMVYTPYEYNRDHKPYKYLVLIDGEDYINILSAKNVMDNLISLNKIEPMVVIFIGSIGMRRKELRCNNEFVDMVSEELIPWIRSRYNISFKSSDAIIGGLSLGGLTASYMGLKHSEVFGNILSQSGSYWYYPEEFNGNEDDCWISTIFKSIEKLPLKFYMNVGIIEKEDRMIGTNIKLRDTLLEKGYDVKFEYFNSGHDYLSWGETLANGLISLIGINND